MSIRSLFGGRSKAVSYPSDTLTARDGSTFTITFFKAEFNLQMQQNSD